MMFNYFFLFFARVKTPKTAWCVFGITVLMGQPNLSKFHPSNWWFEFMVKIYEVDLILHYFINSVQCTKSIGSKTFRKKLLIQAKPCLTICTTLQGLKPHLYSSKHTVPLFKTFLMALSLFMILAASFSWI